MAATDRVKHCDVTAPMHQGRPTYVTLLQVLAQLLDGQFWFTCVLMLMMMMINTEADIVGIVCLTVGQRRPVLWTSLATDHLATYLAIGQVIW